MADRSAGEDGIVGGSAASCAILCVSAEVFPGCVLRPKQGPADARNRHRRQYELRELAHIKAPCARAILVRVIHPGEVFTPDASAGLLKWYARLPHFGAT